MTIPEASRVLAMLAMLDNRNVDEHMARAWAWALADVPGDRVADAVQRLIKAGEPWIDAKSIRRELGAMQTGFDRDVRSAKARGLIAADWHPHTPLPVDIERQLRALQADDWTSSNDRADEITGGPAAAPALGLNLRSVP